MGVLSLIKRFLITEGVVSENILSVRNQRLWVSIFFLDPVPATIQIPISMATVTVGNNISVSCVTSGNPVPRISWCKQEDGRCVNITCSSCACGYSTQLNGSTLTLVLQNTTSCHSGTYICMANNSYGAAATGQVVINVASRFKDPNSKCPSPERE